MNSSAQSFHSQQLDSEQQRKLKVQSANPLKAMGSAKPKQKMKELTYDQDDDLFCDDQINQSEQSRSEILDMLGRREKDKEEVDMDDCFSQLKGKVKETEEDIDSMAGTMRDMQDLYKQPNTGPKMMAIANDSQSSFYKPNIAPSKNLQLQTRPPSKISKPSQPAPDWKTQGKKKALKPNLKADTTPKADNSRMDAIYAQLKEL